MNSTEISPKRFNDVFSDDNSDKDKNSILRNGKNRSDDLTDFVNNDIVEEERMIAPDIFSIILRTFGVTLSDFELLILSDSTDINPYGNKIKIDVIYDILKHNNNHDNNHNNNHNNHNNNNNDYRTNTYNNFNGDDSDDEINALNKNKSSYNYDNDYSESSLFALRHIARQIWRSADQLKRFEKNDISFL